eukprot:5227298-Amphidinium_carterae.1
MDYGDIVLSVILGFQQPKAKTNQGTAHDFASSNLQHPHNQCHRTLGWAKSASTIGSMQIVMARIDAICALLSLSRAFVASLADTP